MVFKCCQVEGALECCFQSWNLNESWKSTLGATDFSLKLSGKMKDKKLLLSELIKGSKRWFVCIGQSCRWYLMRFKFQGSEQPFLQYCTAGAPSWNSSSPGSHWTGLIVSIWPGTLPFCQGFCSFCIWIRAPGVWGVLERKLNGAAFLCTDVSCHLQGWGWDMYIYSLPRNSWIAIWESRKPLDRE